MLLSCVYYEHIVMQIYTFWVWTLRYELWALGSIIHEHIPLFHVLLGSMMLNCIGPLYLTYYHFFFFGKQVRLYSPKKHQSTPYILIRTVTPTRPFWPRIPHLITKHQSILYLYYSTFLISVQIYCN